MLKPNRVKQALRRGETVIGTMLSEAPSSGFVWMLANTGFGQGQLSLTPMEMALVAATVADGGVMMEPYLVQRVQDAVGALSHLADRSRSGEILWSQSVAHARETMNRLRLAGIAVVVVTNSDGSTTQTTQNVATVNGGVVIFNTGSRPNAAITLGGQVNLNVTAPPVMVAI